MIRINPLFFIVLGTVFVLNLLPQFLMVLTIALLHEGAHALCSYLCGSRDIEFYVLPWGVCMKCEPYDTSLKEFLVASAGPCSNLIMIMICSIFGTQELYIANFFMLIINLLPVYPLDGGRILNAILKSEFSPSVSRIILKTVSVSVTVIMFAAGCLLLYKTGINFSVLLASLFLCMTSDKIDDRDTCEPLKKISHYMVESEQKAKIVLKTCNKKNKAVFDITDVSGRYIGTVTYKQVLEEVARHGYEIKFGEILEKQLLY